MSPRSETARQLARDLIRCPSVTPQDAGALGVLEERLKSAGFTTHRLRFSEAGTPDIDNLYARIGSGAPYLMFARAYRCGAAGRNGGLGVSIRSQAKSPMRRSGVVVRLT